MWCPYLSGSGGGRAGEDGGGATSTGTDVREVVAERLGADSLITNFYTSDARNTLLRLDPTLPLSLRRIEGLLSLCVPL